MAKTATKKEDKVKTPMVEKTETAEDFGGTTSVKTKTKKTKKEKESIVYKNEFFSY